jgi:hypothetical protein
MIKKTLFRQKLKNKLAVITIFFFGICGASVFAQSSEIGATLCSDTPPTVTISAPQNFDTITTAVVDLEGYADRASNLSVIVNSNPPITIPVAFSAPFSLPIELQLGVNVVDIAVHLNCNDTTVQTQLIVQYSPSSITPLTGEGEATNQEEASRLRANSGGSSTSWQEWVRENIGVSEGNAPRPIENSTDYSQSHVKMAFNWFMFGLILLLGLLLFMPSILAGQLSTYFATRGKHVKNPHHIVRVILIVLIILFASLIALL